MLNECEDDMICDLAEYYHLFNYKEFSPLLVGTLVFGLRKESRVMKRISNQKLTLEEFLLARIADELRFQSWAGSKDGRKNRNRPKSLLEQLVGTAKKEEYATFETMEEFEQMWDAI